MRACAEQALRNMMDMYIYFLFMYVSQSNLVLPVSLSALITVARGPAHPRQFLKPQEYITAAMTDKVTIVNGKLEENDVRIMLDSGSSVSLIY